MYHLTKSITGVVLIASGLTAQHSDAPVRVFEARKTPVEGVSRAPDCYHQFREGGVVVTKTGRIVVIAQGREQSKWSDRSGQDLVCRWSDDQGDTWSKAVLVSAAGAFSICPNASVYDAETDTVHVLFNVFQWNYKDAASRKAMKGRECRQFDVQSKDGGATWSKPRELTEMLGSQNGTTVFGSGEGIQLGHGLHKGRLLVPGGFQKPWGNRVFYSDDHGRTWKVGQRAPRENVAKINVRLECKVAELRDGTIVLNARCTPHRVRAFSTDGGVTWSPQEVDYGLPAISCNGALLAASDKAGNEVLLMSVPTGPKRSHGTVYASLDGGKTWPRRKTLIPGPFAYSSLIALSDGRIGLIYESGQHKHLDLVRFRVEDISDRVMEIGGDQRAVFVSGTDGVANFRIPALCVTQKGTVLAAADARVDRSGDLPNHIDLVLKRSTDGGKTFGKMVTVVDHAAPAGGGDASFTVDQDTGRVFLFYVYGKGIGIHQSRPTMGLDTTRIRYVISDDDGKTWTSPVDITKQVKDPAWKTMWTGPGHGTQLRSEERTGRLLIPCSLMSHEKGAKGKMSWRHRSIAMISDDHGKTWRAGGFLGIDVNETQFAELADGRVLANMRTANKRVRAQAWSQDGGETWQGFRYMDELPDPRCLGSLLRLGDGSVAFTNAASPRGRKNLSLRRSRDGGSHWSEARTIWPAGSAYSTLAQLQDGTILCLYERQRRVGKAKKAHWHMEIWLARIPVDLLSEDK